MADQPISFKMLMAATSHQKALGRVKNITGSFIIPSAESNPWTCPDGERNVKAIFATTTKDTKCGK